MTNEGGTKPGPTLGQAIDAIVDALRDLDTTTRASAIRAACEYLSIPPPQLGEQRQERPAESGASQGDGRPTDIRAFKEAKQPTSANEMGALVAFYLQELAGNSERKTDVDVRDMEKYFKQA